MARLSTPSEIGWRTLGNRFTIKPIPYRTTPTKLQRGPRRTPANAPLVVHDDGGTWQRRPRYAVLYPHSPELYAHPGDTTLHSELLGDAIIGSRLFLTQHHARTTSLPATHRPPQLLHPTDLSRQISASHIQPRNMEGYERFLRWVNLLLRVMASTHTLTQRTPPFPCLPTRTHRPA